MTDLFNYQRRQSSEVNIGGTPLGGPWPIRVQSMTTTATLDTEGCIAQARRIIGAGGEYVRLTTQGVREAENLRLINASLRAQGIMTPLVADVHFNAKVADGTIEDGTYAILGDGNLTVWDENASMYTTVALSGGTNSIYRGVEVTNKHPKYSARTTAVREMYSNNITSGSPWLKTIDLGSTNNNRVNSGAWIEGISVGNDLMMPARLMPRTVTSRCSRLSKMFTSLTVAATWVLARLTRMPPMNSRMRLSCLTAHMTRR